MKTKLRFLISFLFIILISSCEDKDQITGTAIEPELPVYVDTDLNGYGCSDDFLCGNIGQLYYNFLSDDSYSQEFYQFNRSNLLVGNSNHNQTEGLFYFNSYNSLYYIPSQSISDTSENVLYNGDPDNGFLSLNNSNIATLTQDSSKTLDSTGSISLTSTTFSVLDSLSWNSSSNRYIFSTVQAFKDTVEYPYAYQYDSTFYFTLVDTVLNDIYGDIVLLDTTEITERNYREYDILVNGDDTTDVKIKRSKTFSINDIFTRNNSLMFRESTDCNDNYQKDDAELTMSDFELDCTNSGGQWFENSQIPCDSYCSLGDSDTSMEAFCWDYYLSDRLTGHCMTNSIQDVTFCDTGNNLLDDSPEFYYDADGSGTWNLSGQDLEPWEDRNCNGIADISNEDLEVEYPEYNTQESCSAQNKSWDFNQSKCFEDKGNGQWDDAETCYSGSDNCDYTDLYKRTDAPNILMVDYSSSNSPETILAAYPNDVYNDCGTDNLCNEDEPGYDYGTCTNGFSGSEKDCCIHYTCTWDYNSESCDYSACDYDFSDNIWTENLDPNGDDFTTDPINGTEGNRTYENEESILKDFNLDGLYTEGTTLTTKLLSYQNCSSNCGGDILPIIEDSLRQISIAQSQSKIGQEVSVKSYNVADQVDLPSESSNVVDYLNNINIIKTEFNNAAGYPDYDYMLFLESDEKSSDDSYMHYIIKLIHPYYYYAPGGSGQDIGDIYNVDEDDFWKSLRLESDTLLYSLDGQIIEGQTYYSSYVVETDTASYQVHKEYEVSKATANRYYDLAEPECFKITRTITTTMLGPGMHFRLRTETYLKEGFPIVKEDVSTSWTLGPWQDEDFSPISSIEYKGSSGSSLSSSNIFEVKKKINLRNLQSNPDFNFKPFRMTNTLGLQRVQY